METICGVGLPELVILLLIGFVVIGPTRSREVALQTGKFIRTVIRSQWWHEFNDITEAIRDLPRTLVRLAEIEEAQSEIRNVIDDIDDVSRDIKRSSRLDRKPSKTNHSASETEAIDKMDSITDPWGIANASAGTVFFESDASENVPDEPAAQTDDLNDPEHTSPRNVEDEDINA